MQVAHENEAGEKRSFLDKPILATVAVNWEVVLYLTIFALAFALRFWDLGYRALHHDESIHAIWSWNLYTGRGYAHSPIFHGPFLYHINALIHFLFGVSDYTARVAPAIFGMVIVGLPYLLRQHLGRHAALFASFMLALSPSVLYYTRSLRHDAFAATATLLLAICLWRYVAERRPRWLYLASGALLLTFTNHELSFITVFIFVTFLGVTTFNEWLTVLRTRRADQLSPAASFLLLIATITAPLFTPAVWKVITYVQPEWGATEYPPGMWVVFVVILAICAGIGYWWNRNVWPYAAAIFYIPAALLFTSFFSNPAGMETGFLGSLGYWLSQHGVQRGGQPIYYYLLLIPLYEFLPAVFAVIGVAYSLLRAVSGRKAASSQNEHKREDLAVADADNEPTVASSGLMDSSVSSSGVSNTSAWNDWQYKTLFNTFLIYWTLTSLILYSWAGEKMPWLVMHIAIPMILLAGQFLGRVWERVDWTTVLRRGGAQFALLFVVAVAILFGLFGLGSPLKPLANALEAQRHLLSWLALFLLLLVILFLIGRLIPRLGRHWLHLSVFAVFGLLLTMWFHATVMVNFYNGDVSTEMMVYVQTTPDVPKVMREIESIGYRTAENKDLKVAYDNQLYQPFGWYLRDYRNVSYYGTGLPPDDAAVVLVGFEDDHDAEVRAKLGNRYVGQRYKLRWWFPEDYKSPEEWIRALDVDQDGQAVTADQKPGFGDVLSATLQPESLAKLWRYFMYRETLNPLGSTDFMMYVRKDLASGLWGSTASVNQTVPGSSAYDEQTRDLTPLATWGGPDSPAGQFEQPKNLAVAPDGSVYVTDALSNKIKKLDSNGQLILDWGATGTGEGQFNEPWGIAIDSEGNVYVADTWNHRIQKFDSNGHFITAWGSFGNTDGELSASGVFYGPRAITIDQSDKVYVVDTGNHRVQVFDSSGAFLAQHGGQGGGDGQFQEPVGIAAAPDGSFYVADTWNRRIQHFDAAFTLLGQWPVLGWESETASNKPYLATDKKGAVYVTDPHNHRIIKFTASGDVQAVWGGFVTDTALLNNPLGLACDEIGAVLVVDSGNNRVVKFPAVD